NGAKTYPFSHYYVYTTLIPENPGVQSVICQKTFYVIPITDTYASDHESKSSETFRMLPPIFLHSAQTAGQNGKNSVY
ncbi:MAG: hypothetical protein ACOX8G_10640, partial [Eubacterium sp.]